MVMCIDIHLQSGDIRVYWLWLLLYVSAVSVVIVIIAICEMPRLKDSKTGTIKNRKVNRRRHVLKEETLDEIGERLEHTPKNL